MAEHVDTCSDESQKAELKKEFDRVSTAIFHLDRLASQAAHALPAFELWKHSTVSKQLRSELAQLRTRKLPRQKFRFSDESKIVLVEDPLAQVCDCCCTVSRCQG